VVSCATVFLDSLHILLWLDLPFSTHHKDWSSRQKNGFPNKPAGNGNTLTSTFNPALLIKMADSQSHPHSFFSDIEISLGPVFTFSSNTGQ